MENLKQIQTFICAAELLSFKKAAEKYFLSPMAISKQIKALEDSIGEQLFIRSTRNIKLTEFGEQFYQQCKVLQKHWEEVESFIKHHKIEPQGKLKVCVSNAFGKNILMKKLDEFRLNYPKVDLEIIFSEEPKITEFQQGMFDVLFGFPQLPGITDHLKYRKLYKTKNLLCASKQYINKHGTPKSAGDLINYHFLNHSLRIPDNHLFLADGKYITTSKPILKMNSFEGLMDACCKGLGLFLTGDLLAQEKIDSGLLISVLPELDYREFQLYLFYRPTAYEQPAIRAFVELCSMNI